MSGSENRKIKEPDQDDLAASPSLVRTGEASVNNWMVAFLLILVAVLLFRITDGGRSILYDPAALPRAITARGDLAEDEKTTIQLFQEASPSVVYITTTTTRKIRNSLFSYNLQEVPKGTGSGFVWDDQGNIITNFHVIQNAAHAKVTLEDQSVYEARLVGGAPEYDLAVLKIDAPAHKLKPLAVGTSHDLLVGQKVFAIGYPFGLDHTLTTGVISGLNREFRAADLESRISEAIQTDAAINPGNSGGPLLDSAGRLIGVNTAIFSDTGNYAGIGFAIPVKTINRVVPDLVQDGQISLPGMGISFFSDREVAMLIQNQYLPRKGVLIESVFPGSSAEQAGLLPTLSQEDQLRLGDLIIAVGGDDIRSAEDLRTALRKHRVGEEVEVRFLRQNREKAVLLSLMALPSKQK